MQTQIHDALQEVYPFVKKWAEGKGLKEEIDSEGTIHFYDDYSEYKFSCDLQWPVIVKINIEIIRLIVFYVPVPSSETDFLALMKLLGE